MPEHTAEERWLCVCVCNYFCIFNCHKKHFTRATPAHPQWQPENQPNQPEAIPFPFQSVACRRWKLSHVMKFAASAFYAF